jgi:hypothetical protein
MTGYFNGTIDICNNFTEKTTVTNPQYNGANFSSNYFVNIGGSYYDIAQLYYINPSLISPPVTLTNMNTLYNGTYYDLNSFFKKPVVNGLLSSLTTPISSCNGCYSTRLLNGNYTGYILKIRRADNIFMSFYSNTTGSLITSGQNGSGMSIYTFLSGANGYIDTWYDQSGKENHATQTNTSLQPMFDVTSIDFGFINNVNLFLNIPSGTVPVGVLDASYSFVVKHGVSRNYTNGGFLGAGTFTSYTSNSFRYGGSPNTYINYWFGANTQWRTSESTETSPSVASITYNGTNKIQKGYFNGTLTGTFTNKTGVTTGARTQTIGVTDSGSAYLRGVMDSLLIYSSELPQEDITILNGLF